MVGNQRLVESGYIVVHGGWIDSGSGTYDIIYTGALYINCSSSTTSVTIKYNRTGGSVQKFWARGEAITR